MVGPTQRTESIGQLGSGHSGQRRWCDVTGLAILREQKRFASVISRHDAKCQRWLPQQRRASPGTRQWACLCGLTCIYVPAYAPCFERRSRKRPASKSGLEAEDATLQHQRRALPVITHEHVASDEQRSLKVLQEIRDMMKVFTTPTMVVIREGGAHGGDGGWGGGGVGGDCGGGGDGGGC